MTAATLPLEPLYAPDPAVAACSQLTEFMRWCEAETGRRFPDYDAFDRFSVEGPLFWHLFLHWSGLPWDGSADPVRLGDGVADARFFPALRLSYAECLLDGDPGLPALLSCRADGRQERLMRGELRDRVARLAAALVRLGVGPDDRVAAVARNTGEAVVAALAAAAVGAAFSSCAPDMGAPAILARFAPLGPVVLFACLAAEPWDAGAPVAERIGDVVAGLPSVRAVVALDDGSAPPVPSGVAVHRLSKIIGDGEGSLSAWERRPFDHPLFTLFSSGTTGAPKAIRHGAGGTLLEHVKEHRLHCDLRAGDRLFFQTSCGWMMWNWQLSALASRAELVTYDGPLEGPDTFWRVVASEGVTVFGTNAAYLRFCEQAGYAPGRTLNLAPLRAVLSTGSILYPGQYDWVRRDVKAAMPLQSISGGTDILGCFVLGNPNLSVHRGEAQCRSLGLDVRALPRGDLSGPEAGGRVGELVCANPFPSRPLGFHADPDGARFHAAYFAANPGVWTHGDLVEATPRGGWVLHGRSDDVLNVRGIRVGSAEIYRILEGVPEVAEAMAVEQQAEDEPGGSRLVLLVVLRAGQVLDGALSRRIRSELLRCGSAALVPSRIAQVAALPVTLSGKRSEVAARDAVNGRPPRNRDALQNPASLDAIAAHPALRSAPDDARPHGETTAAALGTGDELRRTLQAICERALAIAPIGWSDNLLELGADSLTVLGMLLGIEERAGKGSVPLAALLAAPTIEGLAGFLSKGHGGLVQGAAVGGAPGPRVRPMAPADMDQVCRLLEHGFAPSGIKARQWTRLLDHPWASDWGERGWVLEAGNEIGGFLGTVWAERTIGGKSGRVCNLSSWYVRPEYRGWGMTLLTAAVEHGGDATWTSFTPGPTSRAAFDATGFTEMQSHRIVLPPLLHAGTLLRSRPKVTTDPVAVRELLDDGQRRVFDDHAPYDCLQMVVSQGAAHAYLVVKRRGVRRVPYSEILHCSAPDLLARHLERVKLAILRRQRTVFLTADARLFPVRPRGVLASKYTCIRSPLFGAEEMDKLYSELVLLPI